MSESSASRTARSHSNSDRGYESISSQTALTFACCVPTVGHSLGLQMPRVRSRCINEDDLSTHITVAEAVIVAAAVSEVSVAVASADATAPPSAPSAPAPAPATSATAASISSGVASSTSRFSVKMQPFASFASSHVFPGTTQWKLACFTRRTLKRTDLLQSDRSHPQERTYRTSAHLGGFRRPKRSAGRAPA